MVVFNNSQLLKTLHSFLISYHCGIIIVIP